MKVFISLMVLCMLYACSSVEVMPISKSNYSGRDFSKSNPNEGYPNPPVESAGEGGGGSDGK